MVRIYLSPQLKNKFWLKIGDNPKCHYCGRLLNNIIGKQIDHKLQVYLGGTNEMSNLVPSCRYCNLARGSMDREEFIEWLKKKGRSKGNLVKRTYRIFGEHIKQVRIQSEKLGMSESGYIRYLIDNGVVHRSDKK